MSLAKVPSVRDKTFSKEFEQIFAEHYSLVYRTAYGVTGRTEDAEDVVQTIFLRVLQRELSRDFMRNPRGYLYRAAANLSLTIVRYRRRRALTEEGEESATSLPNTAPDRAEYIHRKLYDAIAELHSKAADIVILHYLHGLSDAEIAKMLGTSRGSIAVNLYRSRARLKKLLTAALGDES